MGRHTDAVCKLCRREGEKLFLKSDKCFLEKCPFSKRSYAPGQHGKTRIKNSEYQIRLREKQKARRLYGLTERQFAKYFDIASTTKGATGEKLLEYLERRLDNVVFRLGMLGSRQAARQLIRNGGLLVNGRKVTIPSYQVKTGEAITVKEKLKKLVEEFKKKMPDFLPPVWLSLSVDNEGKVLALPKREDIDTTLEEQLIVEYYSR